ARDQRLPEVDAVEEQRVDRGEFRLDADLALAAADIDRVLIGAVELLHLRRVVDGDVLQDAELYRRRRRYDVAAGVVQRDREHRPCSEGIHLSLAPDRPRRAVVVSDEVGIAALRQPLFDDRYLAAPAERR